MAQHDRYENDLLKQLTRIANSLEKIEKKMPDAHRVIFQENIFGGLSITYKSDTPKNLYNIEEEQ